MNINKTKTMRKIAEGIEEELWGSYYLQSGKDYCIVRTLAKGDIYVRVERLPEDVRQERIAQSSGKDDNEFMYYVETLDKRIGRSTPELAVACATWLGA